MNFIEAVKALSEGRATRIRRKDWRGILKDFSIRDNSLKIQLKHSRMRFSLNFVDVLAEDWVTE